MVAKTYHDLHITTQDIPRTALFDLPYGLEVSCNRVSGWCLWNTWGKDNRDHELVAGEYENKWLVLDVDGFVICNSRDDKKEE